MAIADRSLLKSTTNLSRSVSLTVLDADGDEIPINTSTGSRIELIIPRDPRLTLPPLSEVNVTDGNPWGRIYNLHSIDLKRSKWNENRTQSMHIQIDRIDRSVGYIFIYRFDRTPVINSAQIDLDGWTKICPTTNMNQTLFTVFLDNEQTANHQSLIFGLREMNSSELHELCRLNRTVSSPPIIDQSLPFTANYRLRTFTSSCYYLDEHQFWQTDGLTVRNRRVLFIVRRNVRFRSDR